MGRLESTTTASVLVTATLLTCLGCGGSGGSASPPAGTQPAPAGTLTRFGGSITVLIAASISDAVSELAEQFHQHHGTEVNISSGPSNILALQIIAGAPADVLISANQEWADEVRKAGEALELRPLLSNELVLVVPSKNPAGVRKLEDLTGPRVIKVALADDKVPAGIYARAALRKLNLYDALAEQNKLVFGHDVRVTLNFVERGEAEAGIVYATDARITDRVTAVRTLDPATYPPIVYPLVLLKHATGNPAAKGFYDYLLSPEAEAVFRKYGFTQPH